MPRLQSRCLDPEQIAPPSRPFELCPQVVNYALTRPAREVLFTVVSRDERYRAKLVIDTAVQRFGDALAAALFQVLQVSSGPCARCCPNACVRFASTVVRPGAKEGLHNRSKGQSILACVPSGSHVASRLFVTRAHGHVRRTMAKPICLLLLLLLLQTYVFCEEPSHASQPQCSSAMLMIGCLTGGRASTE